ncbi:MAG: gp436 family protein [Aeromonas veronii]
MYATALQLLQRYQADEIAQRADQRIPRLVTGEMLAIAADGGDLSGFAEDERVATLAALALVKRVLQDARQTIDAYVGSRYKLPLTQAPDVLERIACQLARYGLYDDRATDQIKALRDDSIKFLEQIATGRIQLGVTALNAAPASAMVAQVVSGGTVFGRDSSKDFI